MCDCDHPKIKCMVCHRYLDKTSHIPPTYSIPALKRIEELENENMLLKIQVNEIKQFLQKYQGVNDVPKV